MCVKGFFPLLFFGIETISDQMVAGQRDLVWVTVMEYTDYVVIHLGSNK